jgi:Ca2+-binding EF-hand superfamily protein
VLCARAVTVAAPRHAGDYDATFAKMDGDADGTVTKTELAAFMRAKSFDELQKEDPQFLAKATAATDTEFASFDADKDGFLTKAELHKEKRSNSAKASDARHWKFADADQNGKLDKAEYFNDRNPEYAKDQEPFYLVVAEGMLYNADGWHRDTKAPLKQKAHKKDQRVSKDEFVNYRAQIQKATGALHPPDKEGDYEVFLKADANADGELTLDELTDMARNNHNAWRAQDKIFEIADTDGTEGITAAEFDKAARLAKEGAATVGEQDLTPGGEIDPKHEAHFFFTQHIMDEL